MFVHPTPHPPPPIPHPTPHTQPLTPIGCVLSGQDPELAAKRQKAIDEITLKNDIGASRAPWTPPERTAEDERISKENARTLRESIGNTFAKLNPFGGKDAKKETASKAAKASPATLAVDDADEGEEDE